MNPTIEQQIAQNQLADNALRFSKLNDTQRRIEEKIDRILEILEKETPEGTVKK